MMLPTSQKQTQMYAFLFGKKFLSLEYSAENSQFLESFTRYLNQVVTPRCEPRARIPETEITMDVRTRSTKGNYTDHP